MCQIVHLQETDMTHTVDTPLVIKSLPIILKKIGGLEICSQDFQ